MNRGKRTISVGRTSPGKTSTLGASRRSVALSGPLSKRFLFLVFYGAPDYKLDLYKNCLRFFFFYKYRTAPRHRWRNGWCAPQFLIVFSFFFQQKYATLKLVVPLRVSHDEVTLTSDVVAGSERSICLFHPNLPLEGEFFTLFCFSTFCNIRMKLSLTAKLHKDS